MPKADHPDVAKLVRSKEREQNAKDAHCVHLPHLHQPLQEQVSNQQVHMRDLILTTVIDVSGAKVTQSPLCDDTPAQ